VAKQKYQFRYFAAATLCQIHFVCLGPPRSPLSPPSPFATCIVAIFVNYLSFFSLLSSPPACVLRTLPAATSTALPPAGGTLATILCTPEMYCTQFRLPRIFRFLFLRQAPHSTRLHLPPCGLAVNYIKRK